MHQYCVRDRHVASGVCVVRSSMMHTLPRRARHMEPKSDPEAAPCGCPQHPNISGKVVPHQASSFGVTTTCPWPPAPIAGTVSQESAKRLTFASRGAFCSWSAAAQNRRRGGATPGQLVPGHQPALGDRALAGPGACHCGQRLPVDAACAACGPRGASLPA